MTSLTPAGQPIPGHIHQWTDSNWAPLLALVGDQLAGWFMWMGEIRLDDGTAIHAFKHRDLRRYCHLAEDGRAFEFVSPTLETDAPGSYRQITRVEAIDEAFRNWSMNYLRVGEAALTTRQINEARAKARTGAMYDVDPAELELQRAHERQSKAA